MSDPVTNVEIEDVLSSIRRLLSEDGRQATRSAPPEAKPAPQSRLVLTPALRIEPSEHAERRSEPSTAFALEPEARVPAEDKSGPPCDAQTDRDRDGDAPETSRAPWTDPEATLHAAARQSAGAEDAAEADDTRSERIAALERAVAQTEDEWEPDGDRDDGSVLAASDDFVWKKTAEAIEADFFSSRRHRPAAEAQPSSEADEGAVPSEEAHPVEVQGLSDGDVEGEPAARSQVMPDDLADPEPDAEAASAEEASSTQDVEDDAEAASAEESSPTPNAEDHGETPSDATGAEDEAVIDEEALRRLVADIVRQELQGPLGERITRNVRKLVRREIYRALTAQEFDPG